MLNLFFSSVSTGPGRTQRAALLSVVEDIKKEKPPQVIAEYWIGFFIRDIYLREDRKNIEVPYMMNLANFSEYENWLNENQDELPDGTMLVSGLASYVYYGAHYDGFRLNYFTDELDPRWELVNTYNNLDFLPVPEPARLWRWKGGKLRESSQTSSFPRVSVTPSEKPKGLFDQGMEAFDTGQCPETREFFRIFIEKYPRHPLIGDARYFTAICSFRAGEWGKTIEEFNLLISKNPESIWVGGANYHIGVSLAQMGEEAEARRYFNKVINEFSHDAPLVKMARGQLESLPQNSERGLLGSFLDWFKR